MKFSSRKEFQKMSKKIYAASLYNGWLKEICAHMDYKQKPNYYWNNIENCRMEALKYKTKTEFIRKSSYCYYRSLKNGWLSNICKHMINIGDRYNKCVYVYEFNDNHAYVGLTYNMNLRIANRKRSKSDAVTIHINKTGLEPIIKKLTEYISVDEAIKLEYEYLQQYKNSGWVLLNRSKTGGIGSTSPKWNYMLAKRVSRQYPTITEFEENNRKLFEISKRSGWLESFYE
ncbi:MAG: GIY-YIG nuclease family protein [Richelia sp. RM2_1_2]|nr:GIY-YIG nuclease family protein [Richelia sp. RM2_1_2]